MSDSQQDVWPLKKDAPPVVPSQGEQCVECGKMLNAETPQGLCADCSLRNMLDHSFHPTANYSSLPLIDHPDKDVTIDQGGRATLTEPLSPGQKIGSFEILSRLGRGGMGTVYEAQDSDKQRRIALKVLNRPVDNDAARKRFLREGRLAASINHPNSVFVFGTHQVQEYSLISMELVSGGTLEQRVKAEGPLASRQAVDIALQLIDGLEAAYAQGILHRDIKPANCFEDKDGVIKVGDFGLSISTEPKFDACITAAGTLLGTPAFSSPEQLRGDMLDVRSDIYALGATLYYLLTGRTTYQADNLAKLLSQVFEKSPVPPQSLQPEISAELSQLVMRCLAKEPGDRFRNYSELREALLPFSSQVQEPASLGWRTVAGLLDWTALGLVSWVVAALASTTPEPVFGTNYVASRIGAMVFAIGCVLYFALGESIFGQTIAKRILGLRTIGLDGGRPTFLQALTRAAIFVLLPNLFVLPYNLLFRVGIPLEPVAFESREFVVALLLLGSKWGLLALLFSTARTRNRLAALHGLCSQTRVVSNRDGNLIPQKHPSISLETESMPTTLEQTVGPYQVLHPLETSDGSTFCLGFDPVLLRQVWLRLDDSQCQPNPARATRLRWLNRVETDGKVWNVFEAPSGTPLLRYLQTESAACCGMKPWLTDLVRELESALQDETLPDKLELDQLWLTDDKRLKVLDFSAPGINRGDAFARQDSATPSTPTSSTEKVRRLFQRLAPHIRKIYVSQDKTKLPPPLYLTQMLNKWESDANIEELLEATESSSERQPLSAGRRRFAMAAACYAFPLMILFSFLANGLLSSIFFTRHADLKRLHTLVNIAQENEANKDGFKLKKEIAERPELEPKLSTRVQSSARYVAATQLIAGQFPNVLDDARMQSLPALQYFYPAIRTEIRTIQQRTQPTNAEIEAASDLLATQIEQREKELSKVHFGGFQMFFLFALLHWIVFVAIPAAIAGFLFQGGLVIHAFRTVIVRTNGVPASSLWILFRAVLSALPGCSVAVLLMANQLGWMQPVPALFTYGCIALVIGCGILSSLVGTRSLADRMLGTAIVVR
ncbi:serine/threonine protein kinase [Roseimaritima ulvae]|uniref:Serine/threonine-protein kinase PknB n=1 Tax=Roseimaritima ulvae TaxID=980254 RepID=A0A5B9QJT6_9BACT|nr:protein kinase [Roseimaritima ulvae]QEG39377.1 Serine/threonine-protein kinase PknB [Roseimaritima ulvae]